MPNQFELNLNGTRHSDLDVLMQPPNPAWWAHQSGATAIEYGLIAGSISIAIFVVIKDSLSVPLNKKFGPINTSLK